MTSGDRHLSERGLEDYLRRGVPAIVPIQGQPTIWLVIDPMVGSLAIRAPFVAGDEPDLSKYRHLDMTYGNTKQFDWAEFVVTGLGNIRPAYPVLRAVADRVQNDSEPLGHAVISVLGSYQELLSALGQMSRQAEIGLFGELLVLSHLIDTAGEVNAVAAWRGPSGEEHDFSVANADFEVKTTAMETRSHRISSFDQLRPSPGRSLWLVSCPLTEGLPDAPTLGDLIDSVAGKIGHPDTRRVFDEAVRAVGWDSLQRDLYSRPFSLRAPILTYVVNETFPAITVDRLSGAGVAVERIRDLSYTLDLAGFPATPPPPLLEGIGDIK